MNCLWAIHYYAIGIFGLSISACFGRNMGKVYLHDYEAEDLELYYETLVRIFNSIHRMTNLFEQCWYSLKIIIKNVIGNLKTLQKLKGH